MERTNLYETSSSIKRELFGSNKEDDSAAKHLSAGGPNEPPVSVALRLKMLLDVLALTADRLSEIRHRI